MSGVAGAGMPAVDSDLLVAHLEYAAWAAQKTLHMVDHLPPDALVRPVVNSFPTLLATLQHVYAWDRYYFVHLQGGHADRRSIEEPPTYEELARAWTTLHQDMVAWGKENLAARKDVVLDGWGIWPTWMVVMQVASHATHHLGQVVTLLRQLGYTPQPADGTDLIRFYLRRYPQENQKERVKAMLA